MILGLLIVLQIPNVCVPSSSGRLEDTKAGIEERAESVLSSDVGKNGWPWGMGQAGERTDFRALPIAPLMEARWWPAQSYSTLSFETGLRSPINGKLYIWAWILHDLDPSEARWFTFWFDNNLIQQTYVITEFQSCVEIPANKINWGLTGHRLEVSVDGCTTTNGWKLVYLWLGIGSGPTAKQTPPLNSNGTPYLLLEYTPKYTSTTVTMEYLVYAGEATQLQIQVQNVADTTRDRVEVSVYAGTWLYKGDYYTGNNNKTINLGTYTDESLQKMKLTFIGLTANQLYNKRIVFLGVTHIQSRLEIDYMDKNGVGNTYWDQSRISAMMNEMNRYYGQYAYHRVAYEFSDTLPYDAVTTLDEQKSYFLPLWLGGKGLYDHWGQSKWIYSIWVWGLDGGAGGWNSAVGIAIATFFKIVIWHEYGHRIGINTDEKIFGYCQSRSCVMSDSPFSNATYCFEHWLERFEV